MRRIGLLRHFRVKRGLPGPGLHTSADLAAWMADYEASEVIPAPVDLDGVAFAHCLASTSPRALATARAIFPGAIETTPALLEPALRPFRTGRLALPWPAWRLVMRAAWIADHASQREAKHAFLGNVAAVADRLAAAEADTLVVAHAGTMMFLRKALLARGFQGPRFGVAECGRLYLFTRAGHGTRAPSDPTGSDRRL